MYWQDAQSTLLADLLRRERIGLVSDLDGTLSPVVEHRDEAQIPPRIQELLAALAEKLPLVAVVSGRGVDDLQKRVGAPNLVYVGNHGLERWQAGQVMLTPEAQPYHRLMQSIKPMLDLQPGMDIEDKGVTLAIHYRQATNPAAITAAYEPRLRRIAEENGLKFIMGRMIFEFRPPLTIDKGTALAALVAEYRLDGAVFLGDDTTDADALQMAKRLRQTGSCYALGVGVESEEMPATVHENADLLIPDQPAVADFLAWLLASISRRAS